MHRTASFLLALLTSLASFAAAAQVCSSDGVPRPVAVLERFINADCDTCWKDAKTPRPARNEIALDWIVPGSQGDDAPLSIGATRDSLLRLEALKRKEPAKSDSLRTARQGPARDLRVAHGVAFNDYVGTSIALKRAPGAPWSAWLLLVEQLPVGAEGSPVARNLVRNSLEVTWSRPGKVLEEARSMQIAEGAKPERLRLLGLLYDGNGRLAATATSVCR